jgi:hypothetical protein
VFEVSYQSYYAQTKPAKQSKLLKNSQGTLCPAGFSFCLPTTVLCCLGAPQPWLSLSCQWIKLTVKALMLHLQCVILSETCCGKNAEAAENCHIFQLVIVFQCFVTTSIFAQTAHQAATIMAEVCCMRVCNFSILACFALVVASIYKIL